VEFKPLIIKIGGMSERRHIQAISTWNIGKEADRWEEQFYLGADEGAEIDYGLTPEDIRKTMENIRQGVKKLGQRKLAALTGIPQQTLSRWLRSKTTKILDRIARAFQQIASIVISFET
jgi:hypothetical protein